MGTKSYRIGETFSFHYGTFYKHIIITVGAIVNVIELNQTDQTQTASQ
jgi:hypothetical protein